MIALLFASFLVSFTPSSNKVKAKNTFTVVLDAGHGGHDPGNLGNDFLEKAIALDIVLEAGKVLEKNPEFNVIYTRKSDVFVALYKRGQIANQANADLFVSVHCDSHHSDAQGAGTFVLGLHANRQNFEVAKKENSVIYLEEDYEERYAQYDINAPESIIGLTIMQEEFLDQSILLGKKIQDNFTQQLKRKDRKVKQAGFVVLHQTFMPSVLVEAGFLTNKTEGKYLNSKKGQREIGKAIAQAILDYKNDVDTAFELDEALPQVASGTAEANTPQTPQQQAQTPTNSNTIIYKVQLLATSKNLPLTAVNFQGLAQLSKESYKNLYRYMYGSTPSRSEAETLKAQAQAQGYAAAYIVAYKNGQRVSTWKTPN